MKQERNPALARTTIVRPQRSHHSSRLGQEPLKRLPNKRNKERGADKRSTDANDEQRNKPDAGDETTRGDQKKEKWAEGKKELPTKNAVLLHKCPPRLGAVVFSNALYLRDVSV